MVLQPGELLLRPLPARDPPFLLGNGCLCCNFRSDLQVALHRLVVDRERGVIPHFGRVVIETSGLADPSPILTTFATDRALGGEFFVEAVITVIATWYFESKLLREAAGYVRAGTLPAA